MSDKTCSQEFVRASEPKAPTNIINKLCAFTLAEVLITLAIIGVVAALTIPSVVKNYKDTVTKNQFKKVYSSIYRSYYETKLLDFGGNPRCHYGKPSYTTDDCIELFQNMMKRIGYIKYCPNNALAGGCLPKYSKYASSGWAESRMNNDFATWVLKDGSIFVHFSSELYKTDFAIDINGFKGPNKPGYDLFFFILSKNGDPKDEFRPYTYPEVTPLEEGGRTTADMLKWVFKSQ